MQNSKLKIISILIATFLITSETYAEPRNNMSADVVIGQINFTSNSANQGGSTSANTINNPNGVYSDGKRLFIADSSNNRVLIYNSIPTTNSASADVVIGQANFSSNSANQGASAAANTLNGPWRIYSDGKKLFISDSTNNRVLIYNSIPTSNNASADLVIGQANFSSNSENQGGGAGANTLFHPRGIFTDGRNLFIADDSNSRVLIFNSIPTSNDASANVVVGQPDFTSRNTNQGLTGTARANTLRYPYGVFLYDNKLIIADSNNSRVLIYNSIPTSNNTSADVVIGQPNFSSESFNQGGNPAANTVYFPLDIFTDGKRLFIAEQGNSRILIYNSIPTQDNRSANIVIGQPDFTSRAGNQGGNTQANTLNQATSVFSDGKRLFVADTDNNRVLIYNIGGSSIELGPQFEQGKAVLGKVFNDINANGWQDKGERGIEGVKVASDTGIYAITDEDGKYHFPYIETGQHLLKIDPSTLPEGSSLTTESPRKIIVTKGVLTKVSFGVKLPVPKDEAPLLKVSISQDPVLLKPRLNVTAKQEKDNITFTIDCNYFLFIERAKLVIYDKDYKIIKTIALSKPIPSQYAFSVKELPVNQEIFYYQFSVYDKDNNEDKTGIGGFSIE